MLTQLHVRNLAIVDEIEVEPGSGMTALTGETGAGKSILIDALGLVLGDRADSSIIRHGSDRAEISAGFSVQDNATVNTWLADQELDRDGECQLRRIINREGRTRGYINGQPVPMQSLRELGEQLVDIHGQHEHQSLLRTAVQRQLLDTFGGHQDQLDKVAGIYREWKTARSELDNCVQNESDRDARLDLLRYQVQELEALDLDSKEIRSIDEEYARQANAGRLLEACQQGLSRLNADDGDSAYSLITRTRDELDELSRLDSRLDETARILSEAAVLVQESTTLLRQYTDRLEIDPQRLQWLEDQIGILHDLTRKHRCTTGELTAVQERLRQELESIEQADERYAALQETLDRLELSFLSAAKQLTGKRRKAARTFGKQITDAMQTLGMSGGIFEVAVSPHKGRVFGAHGMDIIEFMVSANKGQPLQALARVASGGELSRISLSIQVICAGSDIIPTLIFDEVDSGIGGGVAEIVGEKLHGLGAQRQVLCVTHLPQVAALADHQIQITKLSSDDSTRIRTRTLGDEERIDELARMLGGVEITRQTRKHAEEMMKRGQQQKPVRTRARKRNQSA